MDDRLTHDEQDDAEAARYRRKDNRAAAPYHALLVLERGTERGGRRLS